MASLGNIGMVIRRRRVLVTRNDLNNAIIPLGGNVVANTSLSGAADVVVILVGRRGVMMDRTRSDSSGIWTFYDLGPGTYYAQETGLARVWQVVVDAAGAVTVTRIFSGGGASIGYAG